MWNGTSKARKEVDEMTMEDGRTQREQPGRSWRDWSFRGGTRREEKRQVLANGKRMLKRGGKN